MKENKVLRLLSNHWEFILVSFGLTILILFSLDHIFFWDTVQLGSKHATFFYENDLKLALLPNEIDSGHIPTFGYVLALLWTIFGKSLWISHLYILPFAIGIAWQLCTIVDRFFDKKYKIWVLLIVLIDTTFLSQISLVSPDIPLLFFFLLGLNSIFSNKKRLKAIAFACLFLISLRGMILTVPLFIFDIFLNFKLKSTAKEKALKLFNLGAPYIPAALIFFVFSWFHYSQKGWIGYHEDSPWAIFFERVEAKGMLKNIAIFGWRLLDFGRVAIWFLTLILFVYLRFKKIKFTRKALTLGILFGLISFFLSIPAIIYYDLKGHRYFMPIYFSFSIFACYLLLQVVDYKLIKKIGIAGIITSLVVGSFWVYPDKISQGWDSTLGHFPYYKLRDNMIKFMDDNGIDKTKVGFDFPGAYPQKFLDLSEKEWKFPEVNFETQNYILFSNAVNDFKDFELDFLESKASVIHEEKSLTIHFKLYKIR